MARLLYRLGLFSARRAWLVILSWIIILGMAVGAYSAFGGSLTTTMSLPGTETEKVTDRLQDAIPDSGGGSATIVFEADDGAFTESQEKAISGLFDEIADVDTVTGTLDPFDSAQDRKDQEQKIADQSDELSDAREKIDSSREELDDGQAKIDDAIDQAVSMGASREQAKEMVADQQEKIDDGRSKLEKNEDRIADGEAALDDAKTISDAAEPMTTVSDDGTTALGTVSFEDGEQEIPTSVKEKVSGILDDADIDGVSIDYSSTLTTKMESIIGVSEIFGLMIAFIVLIVMMRALLPAVLPIISSLIGVGVGVIAAMSFSGAVEMSSVTPVLGFMLALAVGIDYSLFITNRHRRQVREGMDVRESIGVANGTAGNAVVFAGLTVVVALLALNLVGISFLGVMGTVAAGCVLAAVLVAVTVTPALLGLVGSRVLRRKERDRIGQAGATEAIRPMRTWAAVVSVIACVVVLLIVAVPSTQMRLGMPDGSSESTETTQYRAYTTIAEKFGAGLNGTLIVVADLPDSVDDEDRTGMQAAVVDRLMGVDHVAGVVPASVSDDGTVAVFQVVPEDGPSSESTEALVHELRDLGPIDATIDSGDGDPIELDGIELGVAGQASGNIDLSEKLADALPIYLIAVVGMSLLILILVFRSLLVPLIASAGFVLSLFATLGAVTAVFQWGWLGDLFGVHDPGPVLSFAPTIIIGTLFGLAMDYQLFLVTGMREAYVHGASAREAVVSGRRHGQSVVIAAAIIMISVFGGFVFSDVTMIRPLGFGLAVGVLFDAFAVRLLLIPATMHLLGRSVWWIPRWLDRILPDVDVEGAKLLRDHPSGGSATGEPAANSGAEAAVESGDAASSHANHDGGR